MYELIESNKRRSFFLVFLFSALVVGLGYLLTSLIEGGEAFFLGVLAFNLIAVLISFYGGDKVVMATMGAKQIEKSDDPELFTIVENLAITAGMPMPKVYVIPDQALNAFATGRNPEHASVAITVGLRRALHKSELEAVMGHELSHIKNYDTLLMVLAAVLLGMIVLLADILWRVSLSSGNRRGRKGGLAFLLPIAIIASLLSPLVGRLIRYAISRQREFLADASSVMLTRYPEAMISALKKLSASTPMSGHHEAVAHLFIVQPMVPDSFLGHLMTKYFSTHPPIPERIAALQQGANIRT